MTSPPPDRRRFPVVGGLILAGLALAAVGVTLLAIIQPTSTSPDAGPEPPPGAPIVADPSSGNAVGERPADPARQFGDGSYLDGNDYLRGVNVYSLIFAGRQDDYSTLGESQASYDFLASRGVSIVRLAVPWQRLQEIPAGGDALDGLAQPVDEAYLDVVSTQVERAAASGIRTIVDLHNGCTYPWGAGDFVAGSIRCGDGITEAHVTTIWTALAERFNGDERVAAYDIFNEPRWSVGIGEYMHFAQVAVDAIRGTGDQHTIWVEGILSDTRGRLAAIAPNGPWIEDPLGRIMYSEHFYDNERGDEYIDADARQVVLERLRTFGDWCSRWQVRCAVGEVGWPSGGVGGVQTAESGEGWNDLFTQFYAMADEYELDVTYFAASSYTQTGTLLAYVASVPGGPLDTVLSQAAVIEAHLSRPAR